MHEGEQQGPGSYEWTAPGELAPTRPSPPPVPPTAGPSAPPPVAPVPGPPHAAFGGTMPGGQGPAPTFRSWKPGIIALRPQGFGDFLSVPFRAMRFNRAVVVGGPLAVALATSIASALTLWLVFTEPMWNTLDPLTATQTSTVRTETLAMAGVTVVVMLLGDVFATAIVTPGVARAVLGERLSLGEAWKEVRPRLGALLGLWLLTSGVLLVALALSAVPMVLGIVGDNEGAIVGGYLLVLATSVVLGGAAGFISGLARPLVVLEKRGPIAAVRRLFRLIKGRFWWTVLILVVAGLLIGVATGILQQVAGIGAVLVLFLAPTAGTVQMIAFLVVVGLGLTVATTATYAYLGALYPLLIIDLRIRHEGFDLTLAEAAEARRRT